MEADEEIAHYADPKTGLPTDEKIPDNWLWNEEKFLKAIKQEGDKPIFICGGANGYQTGLNNSREGNPTGSLLIFSATTF